MTWVVCLMQFHFLLSSFLFSYMLPSLYLHRPPLALASSDLAFLSAFGISWDQHRTSPKQGKRCSVVIVDQMLRDRNFQWIQMHLQTAPNQHKDPTAFWKNPLCRNIIKYFCYSLFTTWYIRPKWCVPTHQYLCEVYLWGFSAPCQQHIYSRASQSATRVCQQAQHLPYRATSDMHSLPPIGNHKSYITNYCYKFTSYVL